MNYLVNFVILILMIWSTKAEEQAGENRDSRLCRFYLNRNFYHDFRLCLSMIIFWGRGGV